MDLKTAIIDFMRERPFLWNSKDPDYKDGKKRAIEFEMFSEQIKVPVSKIKNSWHVLRTNFFRAHKLIQERPPETNEKLWKYYASMSYILENFDPHQHQHQQSATDHRQNSYSSNYPSADDMFSAERKIVLSNNAQVDGNNFVIVEGGVSVGGTGAGTDDNQQQHPSANHSANQHPPHNQHHHHPHHHQQVIATNTNHTPVLANSTTVELSQNNNNSRKRYKRNSKINHNNNNNASNIATTAATTNNNQTTTTVAVVALSNNNNSNDNTLAPSSTGDCGGGTGLNLDLADIDDELYAKSLACTLRKFDPTTKEIIKLKFQEIIVRYMQQRRKDVVSPK